MLLQLPSSNPAAFTSLPPSRLGERSFFFDPLFAHELANKKVEVEFTWKENSKHLNFSKFGFWISCQRG